MTPEQIDMVKDSWEKVMPISEKAAKIFYARLFELKPAFKSLFKHDMKEQGRKLMAMLTMAVNSLDNLADIIVPVQEMGRRHAAYGVKEDDYETVGEALIWTLEKILGDSWTDELEDAWTETYITLAGVMTDAAREVTIA